MWYLVTLKGGSKVEVEADCLANVLDGTTIDGSQVTNIQELDVEFPDNQAGS